MDAIYQKKNSPKTWNENYDNYIIMTIKVSKNYFKNVLKVIMCTQAV